MSTEQIDSLIAALDDRRKHYVVEEVLGLALSAEYHTVTSRVQDWIAYKEALYALTMTDLPPEATLFFNIPDEPGLIGSIWDDAMLAWCTGR